MRAGHRAGQRRQHCTGSRRWAAPRCTWGSRACVSTQRGPLGRRCHIPGTPVVAHQPPGQRSGLLAHLGKAPCRLRRSGHSPAQARRATYQAGGVVDGVEGGAVVHPGVRVQHASVQPRVHALAGAACSRGGGAHAAGGGSTRSMGTPRLHATRRGCTACSARAELPAQAGHAHLRRRSRRRPAGTAAPSWPPSPSRRASRPALGVSAHARLAASGRQVRRSSVRSTQRHHALVSRPQEQAPPAPVSSSKTGAAMQPAGPVGARVTCLVLESQDGVRQRAGRKLPPVAAHVRGGGLARGAGGGGAREQRLCGGGGHGAGAGGLASAMRWGVSIPVRSRPQTAEARVDHPVGHAGAKSPAGGLAVAGQCTGRPARRTSSSCSTPAPASTMRGAV